MKLKNATLFGIIGFFIVFIFKLINSIYPNIYANHTIFIIAKILYLICLLFIVLFFKTIGSDFYIDEKIKQISNIISLLYGLLIFFQIFIFIKSVHEIIILNAILTLIIYILLFIFFIMVANNAKKFNYKSLIIPSYLTSIWAIVLFIIGIIGYSYLFFKKPIFILNKSLIFISVLIIIIAFIFLFTFLFTFYDTITNKSDKV